MLIDVKIKAYLDVTGGDPRDRTDRVCVEFETDNVEQEVRGLIDDPTGMVVDIQPARVTGDAAGQISGSLVLSVAESMRLNEELDDCVHRIARALYALANYDDGADEGETENGSDN